MVVEDGDRRVGYGFLAGIYNSPVQCWRTLGQKLVEPTQQQKQ